MFLDNNDLIAANPYNTPPVGWTRSSPLQTLIGTYNTVELFARSGGTTGQIGCWVNSVPLTGNTIYAKRVHPANATAAGTASQCVIHNAAGNGYVLEQDQAGTTSTFKLLIAWVVQATALQTFTSYGTGYDQAFELRCIDKTTGTFQFLRNGVQVGSNFTDTTYTGLEYAGQGGTGGRTRSIEVGEIQDFLTITDPIILGGAITATTSGYSNVTSIAGAGMSASNLVFSSGTTTGDWPALAEGLVSTVGLPATGVTITLSDGVTPKTRTAAIPLPAGWASVQFGTLIDEPDYLLAGVPIVSGYYGYYQTNQPDVGNVVIYPDGSVYTDAGGVVTMLLHALGAGDATTEYNVTAPVGGSIVTTFSSVDFAAMSTYIESNAITVAEEGESPISIAGFAAEYAIDSGEGYSAWSSVAGTVEQDDQVKVRILSPRRPGQTASCTLTIGAFQSTFTLTTAASADTGASIMIVNSSNPIEAGEPFTITFDELNAADVMLVVLEDGDQTYYPTIDTVDSATQLTATAPDDLPADALVTVRVYESKHARAIRDMA